MNSANIEDIYALAPMQQGMLFHSLYSPASGVYVEQLHCTLGGDLDLEAFARAWQRVVDRHPALRTAFVWEDLDEPVQVVWVKSTVPLERYDWRELSESDQRERFSELLQADRHRGFELLQAPLMRLTLVRLSESSYHFLWSFHHLLLDGWSVQIVLKEAFNLYEAFCRREDLDIPHPHPYRDYIAWLRRQDLSLAESYWRKMLKGFTAPTCLAVDRPFNSLTTPTEPFLEQNLHLSTAATASLKTLARRHQLTLNSIAQAAWALLLSRYSGEADVVFGAVVAGRPPGLTGVESMVGLFVNTLPVRVSVNGEESALTWLRKLQEQQVELRQYEYSPLVKVQTWSDVAPGKALFESLLVFENYPTGASLPGYSKSLEIRDAHLIENSNYPLTLLIAPGPELSLRIIYDPRRLDDNTISRMLGHYCKLLEGIASSPEQPLSALSLLTESERHQLLYSWNDTETLNPPSECIHQAFEKQVERSPDAVAATTADEQITYRELNKRANQLAHYLQRQGVGPETVVGLLLEHSIEMLVGILGTLKAGAAYLPLDPAHPPHRLSFMLREADARVLLTHQLEIKLPEDTARVVRIDADWQNIAEESGDNPVSEVSVDNLAYVIFTSGSTGNPKGVLVTHRNLVHSTSARLKYYSEQVARFLLLSPFSFDSSVAGVFWTLSQGGALVLPGQDEQRDVTRIAGLIVQNQITHLLCVPPLYSALLAHAQVSDLTSLRTVVVAGESCAPELVKRHHDLLPHTSMFNEYGPTEATVWSSVYRCGDRTPVGRTPIGRPIPNAQLYVLNPERQPVPIGVAGELYIGGPGVVRGYLNSPSLTAERFIAHPFNSTSGARLYKTGDLARHLPDGNLEFLGRTDEQVKVRGYRIELGEIETVLARHPSVEECAVVVSEQDDAQRIVAFIHAIHAREEVLINNLGQDLRSFLREFLPDYMLPAAFMILDKLPVTTSGKVDRRALAEIEADPLEQSSLAHVLPRNPFEEMVAEMMAAVLNREQVGVNDDFFELGGHSLIATQLLSRLREAFQIELPLRSLFESPTVAGISTRIATTMAEKRPIDPGASKKLLRKITRGANLPLSFAQERMWFFDQLMPGSSTYNVPLAIRVLGPLNVPVLERSINEIIRRHEVLRTNFTTVEGRPVQVVAPTTPLKLPIVDLRTLPEGERNAELIKLATVETDTPFDLAVGPLLRVSIFQLGEEKCVLLLMTHHIAFDGWSLGVLSRELSALYTAFSTGNPSPLPELPIQYADFAYWQRELLQGEFEAEQLSYWRRQLDTPSALDLPLDRPRSIVLTSQGAAQKLTLSPTLAKSLKALGRREGVTLFMTLLAAFKVLLYRYTGQEQITVGSPIANRTQLETEGLIGCFINSLALRTDLSDVLTFPELLRRVREVALSAYAHQDLPFEKLVAELQLERDLTRTPLFQVMLIWQNAPLSIPDLAGLTLEPLEIESRKSVFDLTLTMWETEHQIQGLMEYNAELFESATIQRLLGHYQTLLEGIVAAPEEALCDLPLLTEAERYQLLDEWNHTRTDRTPAQCIHHMFEAQVERTPDAVAVTLADEQITYRELNRRANQLAHYLRRNGVGPEVLVGLLMERSLEMVIGMLGILKAGGAYVPLDPAYPRERLSFMCDDAGLQTVVTEDRWGQLLVGENLHSLSLDQEWELIGKESSENITSGATAANLAYVIYTSGSTGKPKGVMIQHSSLVSYTEAAHEVYGLRAADRVLQFASISFDTSVEEIFPCLTGGATLVLRDASMLDAPSEFLNKCHKASITVLSLPTAYWHQLVTQLSETDVEAIGKLRVLILGGERARPEIFKLWRQKLGRRVQLINTYGPTEATVVATTCDLSNLPTDWDGREVPIGRPLDNVQVYVLDKHLGVVPIGVAGDLYISGAGLARGYLNRPALTAERFIEHSFNTTSSALALRLYKTGDRARYLAEGNLEFLGRMDEQVKVRGYRIELGEVESVLAEYPALKSSVVIASDDSLGEQRLIAYVVKGHEQTVAIPEVRNFLKGKLPAFMVPSAFVMLEELPLTASGKVDRRALPAPERTRPQLERVYVAPRNAIEEKLARIWAEVLGLERVGVDDNFFELGGHSLLATQLLFRLRDALQIELPLHWLFEASTISQLAEKIEKGNSTDPAPEFDLQDEVVLDPEIIPTFGIRPLEASVASPGSVLLTGATGFLGAFLLAELLKQTEAEVYCLVRETDSQTGRRKLRANLESYSLWNESFSPRILPVLGDLSQPLLGLSDEQFQKLAGEIDVIYHNGAAVNATYPYSALKATNVLGTQEVLRLACQGKVKPLHFVSTLSVLAHDGVDHSGVIREQNDLDQSKDIAGGYAQSKWVAEKLVTVARSRGLPVSIYRPGRITGHSQTGICNANDLMCKMIKLSFQLGSVPDVDTMVDLTPVDYVSKAIVYLSQQQESLGKAFHLFNPRPLHWADLIEWLRSYGYSFQQCSYDDWRRALRNNSNGSMGSDLSSLMRFLYESHSQEAETVSKKSEKEVPSVRLDCQNTLNGLAGSPIVCPPVDAELLDVYFSYFIESGLLAPPPGEAH